MNINNMNEDNLTNE